MGIPGLINAIGPGERISLSKLAITHLERTARPIRVAVDVSIWLFQVQAGRGGKNPELRALFYRLLKFLALPVHPLFVYDGKHKPPFKRGKATGSSYGSAPIIGLSKILVDLFRFPRHDAPGEAEAECARLQTAGVVDAVMSNDVDALMFGSKLTIMNYSKESGSGTSAATHVTCYEMGNLNSSSCSRLDRAGMILFAMLSGGDYLPSGVPKCGSKLAAEIARAGFGEDLLEILNSEGTELNTKLNEWRERLQYELEVNESGYFQTKHKAVRIPESFPDRTVLSYYAKPIVSTSNDLEVLQRRLETAWDREIDAFELRRFAADTFEWNYRSGARKVIRLLAEPLVSYRLRLRKDLTAFPFRLSENDVPMLQKVYKSRTSFSTDGLTELQLDFVPIDIVGLDLLAEEPNPPLPPQETAASGDEEEDVEVNVEPAPQSPAKKRATKRFDPYSSEKIWVFETLATIGIPEVVQSWKQEESEKASAPKKSSTRKTGPKKKGPIDPGMKRGSILKYGTLTKERSEITQIKQAQLFEAAISSTSTPKKHSASNVQGPLSASRELPSQGPYYQQQTAAYNRDEYFDNLTNMFSLCNISPNVGIKRHPVTTRPPLRGRREAVLSGDSEVEALEVSESLEYSPPSSSPGRIRISYSNVSYNDMTITDNMEHVPSIHAKYCNRAKPDQSIFKSQSSQGVQKLEQDMSSLLLDDSKPHGSAKERSHSSKIAIPDAKRHLQKPEIKKPHYDWIIPKSRPDGGPIDLEEVRPSNVPDILEKIAFGKRTTQRKSKVETLTTPPKACKKDTSEPAKPETKTNNSRYLKNETNTASSYAESVVVSDGYWTLDTTPEAGMASDESKSEVDKNTTNESLRSRRGKKRLPRVSILDLS
ncbi:rad2-like endonuclease [Aspergillus nomiae NRRL 13137]|uniref:Rad2-like endonuclease n=1 Tax=Aspergillus nomiae NRRL (strain ATCC 15546 / NRRL 13137 / CBS 260.88 / M93) TaxID=1509407 RepID=A0A0L1J1K6_ASPN3|nr:rad2-like endonuclease [Aspergillus nomiae NRRL 13137]KNG85691.1 rad2-like endonuclease [Aspergillus nomiae NRRL 13137]